MIVACVLKAGGEYMPWHVDRLHDQVMEHTQCRFACLTDKEDQVDGWTLPLTEGWSGWWSKLELFRVDWPEPVVYLDLDVVVQGDLSVYQRDHLTLAADFMHPGGGNSSVMAWTQTPRHLYDTFKADPARYRREYSAWPRLGDQAFTQEHGRPDLFPRDLVNSYRVDAEHAAPVIAFHGRPKPWDL